MTTVGREREEGLASGRCEPLLASERARTPYSSYAFISGRNV